MSITKANAIGSLLPNAEFIVRPNGSVEWLKTPDRELTDAEINAEIARLQTEYDTKEYQRKRAAEYPPITDYLDGIVKGDQEQIDAYIATCQAVKNKYPKPE